MSAPIVSTFPSDEWECDGCGAGRDEPGEYCGRVEGGVNDGRGPIREGAVLRYCWGCVQTAFSDAVHGTINGVPTPENAARDAALLAARAAGIL